MNKTEFKKIRLKLGFTQKVFAEFLGVHSRTIQRYESGELLIPKPIEKLVRLHEEVNKSYEKKESYTKNESYTQKESKSGNESKIMKESLPLNESLYAKESQILNESHGLKESDDTNESKRLKESG